jgi:hypothetical protein
MLAVFIGFLFVGFFGWYKPSQELSEAFIPSLGDGFVRMETNGDILFEGIQATKFTGKKQDASKSHFTGCPDKGQSSY